jgi:Outer membrane protein beta-barrel domain
MNRLFLLVTGLCIALTGMAQIDTTKTNNAVHSDDTLRVGNLMIIRNGKPDWDNPTVIRVHRHRNWTDRPSKVSTDWVILDLGFANYNDMTHYSSIAAQQFAPGANKDWFGLKTGKSVDVNIWLFMQRFSLIKNVVNFKYGLGIELNNYRYEENIRYLINPTRVIMDTINYRKDKLAADYVTIPLMLNFNFTPHRRRNPYGFSVGASVGYKYSSRQKFKSAEFGKEKTFNSFDLEPWKISYIAELELGWLKLYGSYAAKSMFSNGLNQIPYTVGIRLGAW